MMMICARTTYLIGSLRASSLKQKSVDKHITPLEHIILILTEEAANTNFYLTPPGFEPKIYRTRAKHTSHH
jgi:hypothetical protein